MVFERIEIKKGVSLSVVKTDKFKTNLLTVNLLAPISADTASLNSLLTDVLKRGTEKYPDMQSLSKKQNELYSLGLNSHVSKRGEVHSVTFELSAIDDSYTFDKINLLEQSVQLLNQLIFHPLTKDGVFVPEYVEQEKKNLCDSIRAQMNNKTKYAITRCYELMCEGEPFAVNAAGDIDRVKKITPEKLYEQYKNLIDTAEVEIIYIGAQEATTISSLINRYLPFSERKPKLLAAIVKTTPSNIKHFTDKMQVNQCKLSIGFRIGTSLKSKDYIKFSLFNELFGGSTTSKLFVNVREKKSLCYYCRPVVEAIKGVMVIACGVDIKNKQIAYDAIIEQLEEVKNGSVSEKEIEDSKRFLENAYREITDNPASICNWYLSRIIAGRTDSPDEAADSVKSVTKQDIITMSKRLALDTVYSLES